MRLLLDTHTLLWWWTNSPELSPRVRELIEDDVNEVRAGTECGIAVKNYNDVQPGDQIEVVTLVGGG